MTSPVYVACICDRCSRRYSTTQWPGSSLCPYCDVKQPLWGRGSLVKSAAEILGRAS